MPAATTDAIPLGDPLGDPPGDDAGRDDRRRGGRRPHVPGLRRRQDGGEPLPLLPWLLLTPMLATFVVLLGYPVFRLVKNSFQQFDRRTLFTGQADWLGFGNYRQVLGDARFWTATVRSVLFTVALVSITMVAGMLIALLMRRVLGPVRLALSVSMVAAWALPVIASVTVFRWLFDADTGLVNQALDAVPGLHFAHFDWFATGGRVFFVIGLLIVWAAIPFAAFSLYAALLAVPRELYEAATMDGAGSWGVFRSITWPAVKPLFLMVGFLEIIWDFKVFAQVWAMYQGGPDGATTTLPLLQYLVGISQQNYGRASAVSVLMILMLLGALVAYLRMLFRSQEETA